MIKTDNDYWQYIKALLQGEHDIIIKYDKSKKQIKIQYFKPTTLKLEGENNEIGSCSK